MALGFVTKRRIDHHALTGKQQGRRPVPAFGVGLLRPLGSIKVLATDRLGQFLAHHVRANHGEAGGGFESGSEPRLAGSRQTGRGDQARPAARTFQLAQCQQPMSARRLQCRRAFGGWHFAFRELEPRHGAADGRPVCGVQGKQGATFLVTACQEIGIGESAGQVAPPLEMEVHDRESHVGDRVDIAEAFVELDAIDDDQVGWRRPSGKQ